MELVGLLILALIPRLALVLLRGFGIFHADHAVMGLMAKHVLEGKPMIYYYGQGYMGSIEAFMGALIYKLRGIDILSIQLAPIMFYLLFLIVNFFLLKRLFGRQTSLIANLLLALSPPALSRLSTLALGGYPETLFFGSLTLLCLSYYKKSKRDRLIPFLAGFAAGVGFWTNNLILIYFLAMGVFYFLKSHFWVRAYPALNWRKVLFLQDVKIPVLFRWLVTGVHIFILGYFIWNLISIFAGEHVTLGNLSIHTAQPPFHLKKIKKILWLLLGEAAILSFLTQGIKPIWKKIRPVMPFAVGFFAGILPIIFYSILDGEGYRVIHGSGALVAKEILGHFRAVCVNGFLNAVLGIPLDWLQFEFSLQAIWAWTMLGIFAGLFIYFFVSEGKELSCLFRLRPANYSYPILAFLIVIITVGICFLSNLQAGRYLTPAYFATTLILGVTLSKIKFKWILLALLLVNNTVTTTDYIKNLPDGEKRRRGYESVLKLMEERNVRGGYAHYVTSYIMTFQAKEKIILAPYRSPDRYPAYKQYVDSLTRVAYVFENQILAPEPFQQALDANKISYEKIWIEPCWIFLIDRTGKSELGLI